MIDYEILQDIITDHELCKVQENELAKVVELLKSDRLIKLPCKVGDTVYVVDWDIIDWDTEDFSSQTKRWFIYEDLFDVEMIYAIGKMIFPTKEEAEAKLAELKGTEE